MTRTEWERDWRDARIGLHLHPPAADLLYRRGLPDALLLARNLRPAAANWRRASKTVEAYRRSIGLSIAPCECVACVRRLNQ